MRAFVWLVVGMSFVVGCNRNEVRPSDPPPPPQPFKRVVPEPSVGRWVSPSDSVSDFTLCLKKAVHPNNYSKTLTLTRVRQLTKHYNCKGDVVSSGYEDVRAPNSDFWFKKLDLRLNPEPSFPRFQAYNSSVGSCSGLTTYESTAIQANTTVDIAPTAFNFHVEEGDNLIHYKLDTCPGLNRNTWVCNSPTTMEEGTLILTIHHEVITKPETEVREVRPLPEECTTPSASANG